MLEHHIVFMSERTDGLEYLVLCVSRVVIHGVL